MPKIFVINWQHSPGAKAFITKNNSNRKPYTADPCDPDTKVWKTKAAAERFLLRKDPNYATKCIIEEIEEAS